MTNITFEEYMMEKIKETTGNPIEDELNMTLMSLYKKGYINVDMTKEGPMISITASGERVSTEHIASMMPAAEA